MKNPYICPDCNVPLTHYMAEEEPVEIACDACGKAGLAGCIKCKHPKGLLITKHIDEKKKMATMECSHCKHLQRVCFSSEVKNEPKDKPEKEQITVFGHSDATH